MSAPKGSVDQSRKFGFKESREQYEHRRKQEKQAKWDEKLSKENLNKLREELESLERARFLAPQQNERKRLVSRMIKDLEARYKPTKEVVPTLQKEPSPPQDSDSEDDILFSRNTTIHDEDKRLFIPRTLRKKEEAKRVDVADNAQQTAEEAEKELLAAREDDSDLDAFLDTLQ
ncbi:hypothetical protein ABB37_06510 [Leptomonas pyrrhocoris]|uniref:Uncharacterized protein n=1 Tax=Leptomonas pyrrhocoris TaxID=157538 RepID=A0A0N0VEM5_LEPPY|nr:hypothetical protein ABB37_06510 [Leptomonas pyrrhocoris]KPA78401.1 hypothetical protein ABB37_06510 [Leptomonas pyrrhocoris]|eukprot:XP_015656840.1 hypothetical protein ABB37_06510 [Leptomonas pyrrhocoris]